MASRLTLSSSEASSSRRRVRLVAGLAACAIGVAAVAGAAPANAASSYTSYGASRFLNGSIGGTSLDTLAAIQGVTANNTKGQSVTAGPNTLNASLLNGAINLPLQQGLQLPSLNIAQLGAVSQYAHADANGSAIAASGAILSNGGIALGGSPGAPANASLNLAGLGVSNIANLALNTGAISAQATQAAGANGAQHGAYQVANLGLSLTAPALSGVLSSITSAVSNLLGSLGTTLNGVSGIGGLVTVYGLPSASAITSLLSSISLNGGAITVSLTTGAITVDVGKLLQNLNLNLNALPVGTSLVPIILTALEKLPQQLATDLTSSTNTGSLLYQLTHMLDGLAVGIGTCPSGTTAPNPAPVGCSVVAIGSLIVGAQNAVSGLLTGLSTTLTGVIGTVSTGLASLGTTLDSILRICVNQQGGQNAPAAADPSCAVTDPIPAGDFAERALQIGVLGSTAVLDLAQAAVGPSLPLAPPASGSGTPNPTPSKTSLASTGASVQSLSLTGLLILCLGLALVGSTIGVGVRRAGIKRH